MIENGSRKRSRLSDSAAKERDSELRKRSTKARTMALLAGVAVVAAILIAASILKPAFEQGGQEPAERAGGQAPTSGDQPVVGTSIGQIAPDFTLTELSGTEFGLSDLGRKVVVLDFMATWCGPCKDEMAHLKEIYSDDAYSASVEIVSIDVDDRETALQLAEFKAQYGDDWLFAAGGGSVGNTYGAASIPTLYVIGRDGVIGYKTVGVTPASTLKAQIDSLL